MPKQKVGMVEAATTATTTLVRPQQNATVASAARYTNQSAPRIFSSADRHWQLDCYRHVSICGEARFAARFFGNALSRAEINVMRKGKGGPEPVTSGGTVALLEELFGGPEGAEEMLAAVGFHFFTAGECYLVGRAASLVTDMSVDGDVWEIVAVTEIRVTNGEWSIHHEGYAPIPLGDDAVVIRLWVPNPEKKMQADSPMKSLLPVLREIEWATKHIFAQTTSRLGGPGILLVSNDVSFPEPPPIQLEDGRVIQRTGADAFMQVLADAQMAAIQDQGHPSALVPIVVQVPSDAVDKIKLLHFWSNLDEKVLEMRTQAIHRFALGCDLPPEQVLGMSSNTGSGGGTSNGVSHWGQWQIEEQTIKMFIEPALRVVCNGLTIGYLRPAITAPAEALDYVGFSTRNLRLRPDRSKESIELWRVGKLSTKKMLEENGFNEADLPDKDELKDWLLLKIASGSATPEQVAVAVEVITGVVLPTETDTDVRESRPDPTLEEHPTRDLPEQAALLPAYESLVLRALERAGNRIRQTMANDDRPRGVRAHQMHTVARCADTGAVMRDAWSTAPEVLEGTGVDIPEVVDQLETYCRRLLASGQPHTRAALAAHLEENDG